MRVIALLAHERSRTAVVGGSFIIKYRAVNTSRAIGEGSKIFAYQSEDRTQAIANPVIGVKPFILKIATHADDDFDERSVAMVKHLPFDLVFMPGSQVEAMTEPVHPTGSLGGPAVTLRLAADESTRG